MLDANSQEDDSIKVRTDGPHGPYLTVATGQVPQIQVLFDSVRLPYTIEENVTEMTTIAFDIEANVDEIQGLLDGLD